MQKESGKKWLRRRDDNKNIFLLLRGGGSWEQRGKSSQNAVFRGKCHDNKILKVQIVSSRNFVVIAQASSDGKSDRSRSVRKSDQKCKKRSNSSCRPPLAAPWFWDFPDLFRIFPIVPGFSRFDKWSSFSVFSSTYKGHSSDHGLSFWRGKTQTMVCVWSVFGG